MLTHCANNYGPYHFPEKLIPTVILNALAGKPIPLYGDGSNVRDWLYVEDHAEALLLVMGKGNYADLITFVADRPGHDARYAIDPGRMRRELGWRPSVTVEEGLQRTVRWYLENEDWWRPLLSRQGVGQRLGTATGRP